MDLEKSNYQELIISERVPHYYSEDLFNMVTSFLQMKFDEEKKFRAIAIKEQGTKEKKWHSHIIIYYPPLLRPKDSTFRDHIRKHFGKSNVVYDWKLRKVKKDLETFHKYIFKNSDLVSDVNYFEGLFEKYKGRWVAPEPPTKKASCIIDKIKPLIKRCNVCMEWEHPFCKGDVWDAVVKYYEDNDKVEDEYYMIKLAKTIYYREHRDEQRSRCVEKI